MLFYFILFYFDFNFDFTNDVNRKEALEKRMAEIEKDIGHMSKEHVYVDVN